MVRFENVGLRYGLGPEVLQDVSFALPEGAFAFLTGPSGAGKSSLLRLLYLALKPTRGLITLFGHDIATTPRAALPPLRRRVGVVFQDFRLLRHLSAFDNVALPLRVAGARESDIRRHVSELLTWVGLRDHMEARPPTLSGGQQQRVAIARAVIGRPSLLLADEPTGNVDDRMELRLMHLFEQLNRLGTTVVIATHNENLVSRLAHPRLTLDGGQLTIGHGATPAAGPSDAPSGGAAP
ncbi:MAG: cell division ATP-binding protein FtsE [Rhodobacterales bacterium]|nr:cell division ATP-binding protein FtsE [Rhodobacterales bacterium]